MKGNHFDCKTVENNHYNNNPFVNFYNKRKLLIKIISIIIIAINFFILKVYFNSLNIFPKRNLNLIKILIIFIIKKVLYQKKF